MLTQPIAMDFALQSHVLSGRGTLSQTQVVIERSQRDMNYWMKVSDRHPFDSYMHRAAMERASAHAVTISTLGGRLQ